MGGGDSAGTISGRLAARALTNFLSSPQTLSNPQPLPNNNPAIALATAWAAEMQGKHVLYLEAGSGAQIPVSVDMIRMVSSQTSIPLIVGGGIRTAEKIYENALAGANLLVVGTAAEQTPSLIPQMAAAIRQANLERK